MIRILQNLVALTLNRLLDWIGEQSTPRLILLFQALLLVLYLALAVVAYVWLSPTYSCTLAIRLPVSVDKVWDHVHDVTKNPVAANHCRQTTILRRSRDDQTVVEEWHEDIGSNEIVRCCTSTTETRLHERLVRDCWADAVGLQGQITYLFSTQNNEVSTADESSNNHKESTATTPPTNRTILRLFVTVESEWASFMTPMVRLVLTYRRGILEQGIQDYLHCLCHDMGVAYQTAEAWE